jgi:hypothetical protein
VESGGDDFGAIEEEGVARVEVFGEISESAMFDLAGAPVKNEEPGSIAIGEWVLGDEFAGE